MNVGDLTDTATRVALLARPGVACERLHAALQQAGADIVLVADPADSDADGVRATGAQAILIALEPQVDASLDRYDALLADPDITVIFDEAELAAQREGWDAARWSRHLAAKLHRHQQVLPPGMEGDTPELASEPLAIYQRPESDGDMSSFVMEMDALSFDIPRDGLQAPTSEPAFNPYDPTLAEIEPVLEQDVSVLSALDFELPALDLDPEPSVEPATGGDPGSNERFRLDLDALNLRIADMQLEDVRPVRAASNDGAVLVLAGIGGPDAVRQLLAALPANFARAVLIQQRLEGARHDNLVRQMQRATAMPVRLAESGATLERGHVYVLPTGMGVATAADGLSFSPDVEDLIGSLPSADSAVVLLSGADAGQVDAALAHGFRGAFVAGQSPEGCFDAVASEALVARGGASATPTDIAKQLAARWPS
jgi:chemosensory pili system protein ChpB (putative protein-glutamate methylesterase)